MTHCLFATNALFYSNRFAIFTLTARIEGKVMRYTLAVRRSQKERYKRTNLITVDISGIVKKPAHCWKVFGPIVGTSSICWRLKNSPCLLRKSIIFLALLELRPATLLLRTSVYVIFSSNGI